MPVSLALTPEGSSSSPNYGESYGSIAQVVFDDVMHCLACLSLVDVHV